MASGDLKALITDFKDLWADNGDYLSIHYSGTGSSLTS